MKDNQHEQLFQELGNETAAAIQGGVSLRLFDYGTSPRQQLGEFNYGARDELSSSANDKISTIQILDNKVWRLYVDKDFKGDSIAFSKYDMVNNRIQLPPSLNNRVSSFREVGTV